MKLQKLIIHNIASIVDATIDFEAQPLADSEVFLITGKTGAGKSTILDAICLALYADTPRLDGTQMEGNTKDGEKSVTTKDPRQLMRRNTGEAYVILTFTGSNGVHYEAKWSVARARKKVTGNLQAKSWDLKNLDTDYTFDKDREITAEIKAAIGLDFNQFCRTTMLAQGEFTRFLNSKDENKAAILEKITGVDIYTKVGKKVYEVTFQKQQQWHESKQIIEGIHTLSEQEIADKKKEIDDYDEQYERAQRAIDADKTKTGWIKTDEDLAKALNEAVKEHEQAKAVLDSDEFKAEELLVSQWNTTIDARNWLAAKKIAESDKARQQKALTELESEYVGVLAGYAFAEQEKQKTESDINTVTGFMEGEKDRVAVYENAQTIAGYLGTIANGRKKIEECKGNMNLENEKLTKTLQPAFNKAQDKVKETQEDYNKKEKELKAQEEELSALHLKELRKQHDEAKDLLRNINTAFDCIEKHADEKKRMAEVKQELETRFAEIGNKQKASEDLQPQIHDARVKMDTCKEMLDKQSDTIDKFARTMRQKLKAGDVCPVCRQKITSSLPHEEELAALVSGLEKSFKEAESEYKKLDGQKKGLDAEIKAETNSYQKDLAKYENDKSVEKAFKQLLQTCEKCGILSFDDSTPQKLETLKKATSERMDNLKNQIAVGEQKDEDIKKQRKALEQSRKTLEKLKNDALEAKQAITDCKGRIGTQDQLAKEKQKEVEHSETEAASLISEQSLWDIDWRANPKAFSDELTKQSKEYRENVQKKQKLESQLSKMNDDCQRVRDTIEEIQQLMPAWKELTPTDAARLPNLLKEANDVKTKTSTSKAQLEQAEKAIEVNSRQLDTFMGSHEDMNFERLYVLNRYSQKSISDINATLEKARKQVLAKETLMREARRNQEEHRNRKPEIKDEDTLEAMESRIQANEQLSKEFSEKKGAVNQVLKKDKEDRQRLGQLIKDAEEKKAEYQKWSRLNQLIGDATGKKFRTIAQSYVLSCLIDSANTYMKTLTDRYTLKVSPGTFVISIEDAYQGYASRAASTISGGESFLVSLSLALALSDIGQQLAVDTLFIDEGFGSLSGEPLQNAINTLRSLHNKSGRHVGIISHVEELQERIPVQIQVIQENKSSNSKVIVV